MVLERLKEYIDKKGLSIAAFERSIGMSNASFSKSLKNKGAIGSDKLENILSVYPDISPKWLMTGQGSMIKSIDSASDQSQGDCPIAIPTNNPKEGIPLIPLGAMAGSLTSEQTVLDYECDRYVVPAFKGADYLIQVKGTSMIPTYHSGDIVACQRVPLDGLFFQWNKPYVIDTKQGPLIKRIKPGSDKEHIRIISDNKEYDPFELSRQDINAVALVVGLIRLE